MDAKSDIEFSNPLTLIGSGSVVAERGPLNIAPWLKQPKMKKFMGKQDQLAVIAAGLAAREAGLSEDDLRLRTGIYLCVGYIPFEQEDIESIARNSSRNGEFSMELFSTTGFQEVNPLLTFRCLPNMPIFHVSLNLNIQGPYFITYPGPGQFYVALEQAHLALEANEIDFALVGGVADQNNFLVRHHNSRCGVDSTRTMDACGFICLQRHSYGKNRQLTGFAYRYDSPGSFLQGKERRFASPMQIWRGSQVHSEYGAASLPVLIDQSKGTGVAEHTLQSLDGMHAQSVWRV